jgi:hypothetical protein
MASPDHDPSVEPSHAGWWPALRRHLGWVIAAKLGLLALLYVFFFSPPHRPEVDAEAMGRRLDSAPR